VTASAQARPIEQPAPVDLLAAAMERVRPAVSDRRKSTKQRMRTLWAAAKAARDLGTWDVVHGVFGALAVQAGLINSRGWWTGADVRPSARSYGLEDIDHVITWALRGWNPFEKDPLK
jgi:hypothetical protein